MSIKLRCWPLFPALALFSAAVWAAAQPAPADKKPGAANPAPLAVARPPGRAAAHRKPRRAAPANNAADHSPAAKHLRVPKGFVIELVAAPPLADFPTIVSFDERGRLYVCESAGLNIQAGEQERRLARSVRMLEDTQGNGHFDRVHTFADKLTFPTGGLWYHGSYYVASEPSLLKLDDTRGTGVVDHRQVLIGGLPGNGMGNAVKGPFLSPDGRFYFPGGIGGIHISGPDGRVLYRSGPAPGVFSCRPDGSDIMPHANGASGVYNLVFSPEGEVFGTVTLLQIQPRLDGLLHWVHGGQYLSAQYRPPSYGKKTGDRLPIMDVWGQTAPCGCVWYRGSQFGPHYRDMIFTAHFNTHRVTATRLTREGASYRAEDEDFLTSNDSDFHPTDVIEDADGSLLLIDTGGWYFYGCPLSKSAKLDVRGAIYRIRRVGATPPADPRGLAIDWAKISAGELVRLLDDERPVVRDRALDVLAGRGVEAIAALRGVIGTAKSVQQRRGAVWTLCRVGTPGACELIRTALNDSSPSVRQAAVHALGVLRDKESAGPIGELVVSDEPQVRREAGTALGLIHQASAVPALLKSLRTADDPFLQHALIFAIIEIDNRVAALAGLKDPSPRARRGALIALDQMAGSGLTQDLVAPLLNTDDHPLRSAVLDIIGQHPNWAGNIVTLVRKWMAAGPLEPQRADSVSGALAALAQRGDIQQLVSDVLNRPNTPAATRRVMLEVIQQSELRQLPASWRDPLIAALGAGDADLVRQAVSTAAVSGDAALKAPLAHVAADTKLPEAVRVEAAAVLVQAGGTLDDALFGLLVQRATKQDEPVLRLTAIRALGSAPLNPNQLKQLLAMVVTAGPLDLPLLLRAYEGRTDRAIGLALVAALSKSPGTASLPGGRLDSVLRSYPSEVRRAAAPLLAAGTADRATMAARLAELSDLLTGGNPGLGREIFFSSQTSCSACHRIGDRGETIGPNLSQVGKLRSRRDLLESIVFPSATIVQGFEPFNVATKAGREYAGIISRQTTDAIYLRIADRSEVRLARDEIEELAPSQVSLMPQGLDRMMSREQLRNLIAFLAAQQQQQQPTALIGHKH